MTDYKKLCAELVAIENALMGGATLASNQGQALDGYSALANFRLLANRVRAELAKPEPEGLTERQAAGLAARPLLEQVAAIGDCISEQTVGQVRALADRAAAWLAENPPGQPVAIEPRGCPTPGACSCVELPALTEPEPEGPTDKEILELMPQQFQDDLATVSRMAAYGAGEDIRPGLFRVSLNTGALDFARAVLARWGK